MPITLEKLFSPTTTSSFEFLDEEVTVTWCPWRWTGEMQSLAELFAEDEQEERDRLAEAAESKDKTAIKNAAAALIYANAARIRTFLASDADPDADPPRPAGLLVSWDVMSGKKPLSCDLKTLASLPDEFIRAVYLSLGSESMPDPTKAPSSDEPSDTDPTSVRSQSGTTSSKAPKGSASRRSKSTTAPHGRASTPRGGTGARSRKRSSHRSQ